MKFVEIQKILPDVLLDIRYASTYNFVGEKIDGYIDPIAIGTIELVQIPARSAVRFLRRWISH